MLFAIAGSLPPYILPTVVAAMALAVCVCAHRARRLLRDDQRVLVARIVR